MIAEKDVSFDSILWLKWIVATAIGLFISDYLSFVVFTKFPTKLFAMLDILAAGLIIGTLQWLFVFRSQLIKSQQWIWISTVGWAIGWIVGNLFGNANFISLFIHGTILGFIQWFFFIRKIYPTSFVWVLVNAFGLPLTYILSWRVIFPVLLGGYHGALSGPADSIVRGILFGAITGLSLLWLISRSKKSSETILPNIEQSS
jgi:hypothetical protein